MGLLLLLSVLLLVLAALALKWLLGRPGCPCWVPKIPQVSRLLRSVPPSPVPGSELLSLQPLAPRHYRRDSDIEAICAASPTPIVTLPVTPSHPGRVFQGLQQAIPFDASPRRASSVIPPQGSPPSAPPFPTAPAGSSRDPRSVASLTAGHHPGPGTPQQPNPVGAPRSSLSGASPSPQSSPGGASQSPQPADSSSDEGSPSELIISDSPS